MPERDYVAVCPECGSAVGWVSVALSRRDVVAWRKEINEWLRDGLSVVRMTTEEARKALVCHKDECSMKLPSQEG